MLINPGVRATTSPPIPSARAWLQPARHGPETPLLDLSQAVPSYAPPSPVIRALQDAVADTQSAFYTDILGIDALRNAFASAQCRQYGAAVQADHIAITAGCNQAFCAVMNTLAGSGDNVVLPLPYYFNHQMWLDMLGIAARHVAYDSETGGIASPQRIAAAIDRRTRAIVIVSPNNPTGARFPAETLNDYFEIAKRHGIGLVIDETYKDFLDDDAPPHGLFQRGDWEDTLIQLYSFSKAYSLTGYRVGAVTCGVDVISELRKVLDCTQICAPHVGQRAALAGVDACAEFVTEKRALMRSREAALHDTFAAHPGGFELMSAGAYFAYVRHPFNSLSAAHVAQGLAAQQNLLTLPGSMFGPDQERYLRVAFANAGAEAFPAVAERLTAFHPELAG